MAKEIIASCEASPEGNGVAAKGSIFDPAGGRPIRQLEDDPRYAGYPFVIDQASPTLITLQLKPRAGEFPGYSEFLEVADQCGFRMPWLGPQMLGLISNDTRKLIAPFRSIGGGRWGKPIDQVVIQIDPEASLIEESAGQRLIDAWSDLAEALNADTVDGVGNLVGEEALQALADHITAVMSRRYCAAMTDSCVRLPDGSLRYPLDVSFQNFTYVKAPGKRMSRKATFNYFDVPALPFYAARAQAFRMVEELQRTFAAHEINRPSFGPMIADAFGVEPPRGDMRRGVALRDNVVACFIEILGTVLKNGLANTNPEWLQKSAERSERWAADDAERHAAAKRDFSARMKAAKAAKKAAREGAAS